MARPSIVHIDTPGAASTAVAALPSAAAAAASSSAVHRTSWLFLGAEHKPADYTAVPRVTFTDPEMGSVGLTEAAARARGLDVRVGLLPTSSSDRGWLHGRGADLGVIKVVADAAAGVLVGGSVMGPASGEVTAFLALAIRAQIPVPLLMEVIYPYPTFTRGVRGALRRLS